MSTRVGIVSSQRQPPDPFNWLSAHVAAGISAFYIMFEDSGTLPEAMATYAHALDPSVVFYYETRTVDRSREQNYVDLMGRQAAWVDRMIARARADGVQWLFHIDDDEIAVPSTSGATTTSSWPRVLDKVPAKCASVHLDNVEAFSPPHPSGPFFDDTEVRFLPRACAHLYAAYGNGKSATRTLEGQASHGPHHFRGGKECELKTGVVGHYEGLAMGPNDTPPARWVDKNALRVRDDLSKIPFPATVDGVRAVASGDAVAMRDVWTRYRSMAGDRFQACQAPPLQLPVPHLVRKRRVAVTGPAGAPAPK